MSAIPFRSCGDRFYRYIGVGFTFGLLDCDRYIADIVIPRISKSGFCSIHFTVLLAGLKNVTRYIGNIVISKIVVSEFRYVKYNYVNSHNRKQMCKLHRTVCIL